MIDQDLRLSVASNRPVSVTVGEQPRAKAPWFSLDKRFITDGVIAGIKQISVLKVLLALSSHADFNTGKCWPGMRTLMHETGLEQASVYAALRVLIAMRIVVKRERQSRREGSRDEYEVQYPETVSTREESASRMGQQVSTRMESLSTATETPSTNAESLSTPPGRSFHERGVLPNRTYVPSEQMNRSVSTIVEGTDRKRPQPADDHSISVRQEKQAQQVVLAEMDDDELREITKAAIAEMVPEALRRLYEGKSARNHAGTGRWVYAYLRKHGMIA